MNWDIINSAEVTFIAWALSWTKQSMRVFLPISASLRLWAGRLNSLDNKNDDYYVFTSTCRLSFKPPWEIHTAKGKSSSLTTCSDVGWQTPTVPELSFPIDLPFFFGGGRRSLRELLVSCSLALAPGSESEIIVLWLSLLTTAPELQVHALSAIFTIPYSIYPSGIPYKIRINLYAWRLCSSCQAFSNPF